jgi:hypothetical protein
MQPFLIFLLLLMLLAPILENFGFVWLTYATNPDGSSDSKSKARVEIKL